MHYLTPTYSPFQCCECVRSLLGVFFFFKASVIEGNIDDDVGYVNHLLCCSAVFRVSCFVCVRVHGLGILVRMLFTVGAWHCLALFSKGQQKGFLNAGKPAQVATEGPVDGISQVHKNMCMCVHVCASLLYPSGALWESHRACETPSSHS